MRGLSDTSLKKNGTLTLITPTFNRQDYLTRLYRSLVAQTNKNFIWMIVDDGSTDDTRNTVEKYIDETKDFQIKYYSKKNGGKHTALNVAFDHCETELLAIVDSDDYLTQNAIETIYLYWDKFKNDRSICGIAFLRKNQEGRIIGEMFPSDEYIDTYTNCRVNLGIQGDKFEVFRCAELLKYRFPEFNGERFLGESVVWGQLNGLMAHINQAIYIGEYLGGLSKAGRKLRMACPNGGRAYALTFLTEQTKASKRIKFMILYIIYSRKSGLTHRQAKRETKYKWLYTFCKLPAYLIGRRWESL